MNDIEIAWLAGLLEGEGTFYVRHREGYQPAPIVKVKMTDKDVIERVAILLGVQVVFQKKEKDHYKDQWSASVQGKRAVEVMTAILPHMGERRRGKIRDLLDRVEAGQLGASGSGNWDRRAV